VVFSSSWIIAVTLSSDDLTVPSRLFLAIFSSVKFPTMARERTSNGTVPVSMFSFNFRNRNVLRLPREDGIKPLNAFF